MQALYSRHRLSVYRFAMRITGDAVTAEDVVSDVFLSVWRDASRFEARSQVSTWLLAITRNLAISALRHHPTETLAANTIEEIEDSSDNPAAALEATQRKALLARCLKELTAAHRQVIDLVYYHGRSVSEVSEIVGIPKATIKSRMYYARREIARLLTQYQKGTSKVPHQRENVHAYISGRSSMP